MLDGGPAIWYLNRLRHDMSNGILLTGYQAEGAGGRLLLDEKKLRIFGNITPVELEVNQFSLSNHGGQAERSWSQADRCWRRRAYNCTRTL